MFRICLLVVISLAAASAFAPLQQQASRPTVALEATRREMFGTIATAVVGASAMSTLPAWAEVDDLAMPTEDEQKAADKAALEAKLKRKAELQKAAAKPTNFQDSFKSEMQKKKELSSQTKEERRNAMCEELGRGC